MKLPFLILHERWVPRFWDSLYIGKRLTELTRDAGLVPHVDPAHGPIPMITWHSVVLHAEVRRRTQDIPSATQWHQDGDTTPGSRMDCAIVTWANRTPTEVQWRGRVYQPEPFQVVIFKNRSVSHRRPENAPEWRWMFRQRVAIPNWKELP